VGYQTVTAVHAHRSTTISTFSNLSNRPDTPPQQFLWSSGSGTTNTSPLSAPFAPNTSREWERGLLEEEKVLDKNAVLQKKTRYHYAYNLADRRVVPALRAMAKTIEFNFDAGFDHFYVGRYNILSRPLYLTSIEEEVYDQQATNGVYHKTRTVTSFEYNAQLQLKKKVVGETGVDKQTITEYKYPTDYTFTTLSAEDDEMIMSIRTMFIRHIHNPIIEQTTSVKEVGQAEPEVVSSALKLYARVVTDSINAILPKEDKVFSLPQFLGAAPFEASTVQVVSGSNRFIFDGRYRTLQTLDMYNQTGKVSQVTEKNTLTTSYVWSSRNALPIAQVKSAKLTPRLENYPVTKSFQAVITAPQKDDNPFDEQPILVDVRGTVAPITIPIYQTVTFTIGGGYGTFTLINSDNGMPVSLDYSINGPVPLTLNLLLLPGRYYFSYRTNLYINGQGMTLNVTANYTAQRTPLDVFHTSFEDDIDVAGTIPQARTGKLSRAGTYTIPKPGTSGSYVLSYWQKPNTGGSWTYQESLLNIVASSPDIVIGSANNVIDEVRFYPKDAQMTTFTYDPLVGMTSATDAAGVTTFYEYDDWQRLKRVKDENGNIVKQQVYHYKGQTP
jgi:YD repeat-containing protein